MTVDTIRPRAYSISNPSNGISILRIYDTDTFTQIAAFQVDHVGGNVSSLIRWGSDGLAFKTDSNQIYILRFAGDDAPVKANITSPANGSVLPGSSATFTRDDGFGVLSYSLWVGSSPGAGDIFLNPMPNNTLQVTGIPTDARAVYVRLSSEINGAYDFNDYTYAASGLPEPSNVGCRLADERQPDSCLQRQRDQRDGH